MELEWKRQAPAQVLSLEQIRALISESGIEPMTAQLIDEGLANTNYRIGSADDRCYHLRILQRAPECLKTEVAAMQRMESKMPVPRVRFWSTEPAFLLSDWMPGQTLQRLEAAGNRSTAVNLGIEFGRMLSQLRAERFDQAGFLDSNLCVADAWPSVYDGLRGFLEHTVGSEHCRGKAPQTTLDRVRRTWDRWEAELREATSQPCLSHADFKPSNILVEGVRVSALLDWEFAHAGTWLLDAGQILRYMGNRKSALALQIEQGLAQAGIRPPGSWVAMASTIDTANLCDFLNRPNLAEAQRGSILSLLADELDITESIA